MFTGLAAGYGTFGAVAARYLFPAKPREQVWLYVTLVSALKPGDSLVYRSPSGEKIAIARQGAGETVSDFIALSSTCPHLGCQVHWEGPKSRFFCPCHNGTFDPSGRATGGPPGEAGLSLPRYTLKIVEGLLYIQVPVEKLGGGEKTACTFAPSSDVSVRGSSDEGCARAWPSSPPGPGHDPCLFPDPARPPGPPRPPRKVT
jgi:nitrite reductase/ring-hydroxylating ferredoxin subunit